MKDLVKDYPEVVTVAVNTNTAKTSEIYGDKTEIIWGQDSIREGVLNYEFLSTSFCNSILDRLKFSIVKPLGMDNNENDHLNDAYCGVRTIGFAFAKG